MKKRVVPYLFLTPYYLLFLIFIAIPVIVAILLSFTNFNTIQFPSFSGLNNYITLLLEDEVFMRQVVPNTVIFSVIVGPGGYILSFFLAWSLSQISKWPRTLMALAIYAPSMVGGTAMAVIWKVLFSGDQMGYLNNVLMQLGILNEPIVFLQSSQFLLSVMIIVALWGSMGVGFLAMLAGVLNIDKSLYEAAAIDGVRNRFQEIFYVTIPSMKPQMLFGAIMSITGTFQNGYIGVALSGSNPTPNYAGQLIINHIEDYGFIRYEMGWYIDLQNDDTVKIRSAISKKPLQLEDNSTYAGAVAVIYQDTEESSQLFMLELVDNSGRQLPQMLVLSGDLEHSSCPEIVKFGNTYYSYNMGTGVPIRKSTDLKEWETVASALPSSGFSWLQSEVSGGSVWSPGVYKVGDQYRLYYSVSKSGQNSCIAMAVNETLDPTADNFQWKDGGVIIRSKTGDNYNAIDPNVITDGNGQPWLVFGSYWGGIMAHKLDRETGLLSQQDTTLYNLARRPESEGTGCVR